MSIESSLNFRRVSDTVTTSGTVAAEDLAELRAHGYDVVVNLMPDDSSYAVAGEAGIVEGADVGYVSIPVDFAAPTDDDFSRFAAAMDASAGKNVHVHCAANYRVSAFYSLYALHKGWWSAEEADTHVRSIWDPTEYPAWEAFIASEQGRLGSANVISSAASESGSTGGGTACPTSWSSPKNPRPPSTSRVASTGQPEGPAPADGGEYGPEP